MIELVFGVKEKDIALVAKKIGNQLNLSFAVHDSSFKGQYYLAKEKANEYQIMNNEMSDFDDSPEEEKEYYWQIETHKHLPTLLWFDVLPSIADKIKTLLTNSNLEIELISEHKY